MLRDRSSWVSQDSYPKIMGLMYLDDLRNMMQATFIIEFSSTFKTYNPDE